MELATTLDMAAVEIKTTGDESSVTFAKGYRRGYGDCLSDVCGEFPGINLDLAQIVQKLYAYTRSPAIRVRSIKAYRTSL